MISLYTETLSQYMLNGGSLHKELFDRLPTFNYKDIELNLYDLFTKRYYYCEIGQETEELFGHYLRIKLDEVFIKYANKIDLYIKDFSHLLDRKVELTNSKDDTTNYGANFENYLNPINIGNSVLQDLSKRTGVDEFHRREVNEQAFSYFKSNPEIMEQAMKIENIFYKALDEFKDLFIMIY